MGPGLWALALGLGAPVLAGPPAATPGPAARGGRHSFNVVEVVGDVDPETRTVAKELLATEMAARPELATAAGKAQSFDVSLKFESFRKELKEPRPGGRLKQLAVATKVTLFANETGTRKLAFSGEGEAMIEAEVVERRLAEETKPLVRDALERAIKEAADQAAAKLSRPRAEPQAAAKRKRAKR